MTDAAPADDGVVSFGSLVLDIGAHQILTDDVPIDVPHLQFVILVELARRRGRVVAERTLAVAAAQVVEPRSRTVASAVSRLRAQLRHYPAIPAIERVRSRGYRLVAAPR